MARAQFLAAGRLFFPTPHYSTAFRLALQPIQPPIQWVLGALSLGLKQQGHEADDSSASSAEVKNGEAIPPFHIMS
jgi:hypothetical protein